MNKKWTRENQALWEIYKSVIRAFKISDLIDLQQEDEIIGLMDKYIVENLKEK